jgi:hypothetical protein
MDSTQIIPADSLLLNAPSYDLIHGPQMIQTMPKRKLHFDSMDTDWVGERQGPIPSPKQVPP